MVVQSSHAVTQSPEPVPGPELGDVKPEFTVVAPQDITVERAEELRQQQGENAVALIFDVSPGGVNREQLGEQLRENPRVVICDHHGACAPLREIPGQELCAAEVIVRDLPRLYRAGALTSSNSEPVKLLCITNTMNVDPDCVISKFLIDSYIDPELRQEIWGDPETLNLLVEAARFGDNKFFGGLDPREVNYGTISPSQKLALTVFQMINELKADLVIGTLLDRALLNANHSVLTKRRAARLAVEEYAPEDIADICARERHEDLRGILSLAGKPGEDSLFRFRENYWQFLREQLGEELITLTKLVEQFGGDARPIGEKFIGSRNDA